jgi:N4-gp56 family major capsid protein
MATNFDFGRNDPETVKLWSELVVRDAEHKLFFSPMMYSATNDSAAVRHPDANKAEGVIRVHTEFQEKAGDRLTINNVARIQGEGVYGDSLLRDTGSDVDTYTMDLYFDQVAKQTRDSGKLAAKRTSMDFRKITKPELASWWRRQVEGSIIRSLYGLANPANASTVLGRLNQPTTSNSTVMGNTIQAFDSSHLMYAGVGNAAASDLESTDVLTSQVLSKAETAFCSDLSIPLEGLDMKGEEGFLLLTPRRGIEQLLYDEAWRQAQGTYVRDMNHPLIKLTVGRIGKFWVVPYDNALTVATATDGSGVVNRALVLGKDALQMAKVEDPQWFEDYVDTAKRRRVISIGGMYGIAPTYFNSSRRNSAAIDFYARA